MRPFSRRLFATGGVVGVKGNIAPDGVIVNVGAMVNLQFSGPARCFDGEEACFESARNGAVTHSRAAAERACYADI